MLLANQLSPLTSELESGNRTTLSKSIVFLVESLLNGRQLVVELIVDFGGAICQREGLVWSL